MGFVTIQCSNDQQLTVIIDDLDAGERMVSRRGARPCGSRRQLSAGPVHAVVWLCPRAGAW